MTATSGTVKGKRKAKRNQNGKQKQLQQAQAHAGHQHGQSEVSTAGQMNGNHTMAQAKQLDKVVALQQGLQALGVSELQDSSAGDVGSGAGAGAGNKGKRSRKKKKKKKKKRDQNNVGGGSFGSQPVSAQASAGNATCADKPKQQYRGPFRRNRKKK